MAQPDYNADTGAGSPAPVAGKRPFNPATDRILDKQTLPGGYTQITYQDSNGEVQVGLLAPNESSVSGGSGGYTPASGGQVLANQMDQQQLAQQSDLFFQTMGYEKARFGIEQEQRRAEQGLAQANNTRDFAAAQHWNQVSQDLKQQQLGLDQQKQQHDQYMSLANLASNPRNFVQTFFMNRGQTPPADVARYGNTTQTAADIVPFQQFQQRFMGAAGAPQGVASAPPPAAAPTYTNPVVSQTGAQYPQGTQLSPNGMGVYGSSYQGLSGFDAATGKPRLSPTDPDAAGLMAKNPGMYAMTSPEEVMKYLPQKPKMYAQGGTLSMMGPHAVIDLINKKVVAIAGEAGPENAYFDGAAIIDPGMTEDPYDPPLYPGAPGYIGPVPPTSPIGEQSAPDTYSNPYTYPGDSGYVGPIASPTPAPTPVQNWTPQDLAAMIASANAGNVTTAPTAGTSAYTANTATTTPYTQTITPQIQPLTQTQPPIIEPIPQTATPEPAPYIPPPAIPQAAVNMPGALPQTNYQTGQTTYSPSSPISNITPASVAPPGTFGQPIPSTMPTYLGGENFQAANPVTDAVRNLPFMKRLWAQGRGDPTQGTNTTQRSDLPSDLPLVSSLAWAQLAPSEQQALLSYVSSLGITPEDYLAMIQQNSPQGGAAYSPLFGNAAPFSRQ